jgi:hypothetical protein
MTSFRFWLALMTPFVSHPLYMRRGVWQPPPPPDKSNRWGRLVHFYNANEVRIIWGAIALLLLAVILIGFNNIIIVLVIISIGIIGIGFPLLFALSGTLYGILSALTISGAIINERLQGRYLILGVTPSGFLGAAWALCSLSIQNSKLLRQLRAILGSIYGVALLTALIYFGNSEYGDIYNLLSILVVAFSIMAFFVVDFFQSACVGGLLGIIAPHYSETRANTQNSVISNFLALQFAVYLLAGFICLFVIPSLFALIRYPITPFYGYICVVVLYVVREMLIIALWHGLAITIDDDVVQLNRLTRIRIKDRSWAGHLARRLLRMLWRNPMD